MSDIKHIKSRIRAVENTRKITKAMEMIAASKMQKSIQATLASRAYANLSWGTLLSIANHVRDAGNTLSHPLLDKRETVARSAMIVIAGNRGLCGGFNTAVMRKAYAAVHAHEESAGVPVDLITVGKKADMMYAQYGYNIVATFPKDDALLSPKQIEPLTQFVIDAYQKGIYDRVFVAYTDYVNPALQIPQVRQLLPVDITAEHAYLGMDMSVSETLPPDVTFEPDAYTVLGKLIPHLIEMKLYQTLLESNASEHAARMTAMRQASDSAGSMKDELTLYYNKARQANITAEIAEIAAAANALLHG
ncbi:MAG: ATP synthase F1 subunit gamma [Candidatus Yonathbacteria bacterium]|nr:ATP synthase F1 subunit gamma [Candidatus Yonathbacteria bacterium]